MLRQCNVLNVVEVGSTGTLSQELPLTPVLPKPSE